MKVFRLNDYEWYVGPDLESCIQHAMEFCGVSREEAADDPRELSDADVDSMKINVSEDEDPAGPFQTGRELLDEMLADGQPFPRLFCGTDW